MLLSRRQVPPPGTSREVRLRRTVAGAVTLIAVSSSLVGFARRDAPTATAAERTPAAATRSAPTPTVGGPTPRPSTPPSSTPTPSSTPPPTPSSVAPAPTHTAGPAAAPDKGSGRFTRVQVPGSDSTGNGRVVTYSLQVENGMHADNAAIARTIGAVLRSRFGWQAVDGVRFVQVTPHQLAQGRKAQISIVVASPKTTNALCAPAKTDGEWSCFNAGQAVLNYRRWTDAVPSFKGDLAGYREYLINHEVGHGLGHRHESCPRKGAPAPVMQEQSMSLQGCTAWFWPVSPAQVAKLSKGSATKG